MFLHNIEFDKFNIVREDTLLSPMHWDDQPFELIVSNPPFSVPWEGDKNPLLINDPRFSPAGVLAPASKGDMAFIMHSLSWLANNGAAAIVCFPGIMYRSGAEQKIRKYLVDNNYVDAVIQLPSNLFLNVTISVDILVLRKNKTDNSIIFVDASGECVKVTKNNRLAPQNIENIVNAVAERKDVPHFCRLVPNSVVGSKENAYNLSVSTYVEAEDTREKVDINAINAEIAEIVAREAVLRAEIDKIIAEIEVDE
jgi:type I restriction enzyme M protein